MQGHNDLANPSAFKARFYLQGDIRTQQIKSEQWGAREFLKILYQTSLHEKEREPFKKKKLDFQNKIRQFSLFSDKKVRDSLKEKNILHKD